MCSVIPLEEGSSSHIKGEDEAPRVAGYGGAPRRRRKRGRSGDVLGREGGRAESVIDFFCRNLGSQRHS